MSKEYGIWHTEMRAWARICDISQCFLAQSKADLLLMDAFAVFNTYDDAQEWLDASGHTQYEVRSFPV